MVKSSSSKLGQDSDVLLMEAWTGPVFVLYCSTGHLHLGSSLSKAPADITLKLSSFQCGLYCWTCVQLKVQGMMLVDMGVPGACVEASKGPGRLCSILPGNCTGRESKISSTLLGLASSCRLASSCNTSAKCQSCFLASRRKRMMSWGHPGSC